MTTTIKSTIAVCGFLAAVSAPLTAGADTSVFFGKDAYGYISGSNGNLSLQAYSFEGATKSKSDKTNSSGAYIYGSNYTGSECWDGYGFTDTIQFQFKKTTGSLPKQLTASGSVLLTWVEYCTGSYPYPSFTETVTFNMDLRAMIDQAYSIWSADHSEYGNVKTNGHYDYSYAPAAAVNGSSISSPAFGTVTPSNGEIGRSKGHIVEITR